MNERTNNLLAAVLEEIPDTSNGFYQYSRIDAVWISIQSVIATLFFVSLVMLCIGIIKYFRNKGNKEKRNFGKLLSISALTVMIVLFFLFIILDYAFTPTCC